MIAIGGESLANITPWFMYLIFKDGVRRYKCGGSLINKSWMVTAAHCFCSDNHKFFKCKKKGRLLMPMGYSPKRDVQIVFAIQPKRLRYTGSGNSRQIGKLVIHSKFKVTGNDLKIDDALGLVSKNKPPILSSIFANILLFLLSSLNNI